MYKLVSRSESAASWKRPKDIPLLIYQLLLSRGISSEEEARAFLNPDAGQLHDAFLLPGIDQAAKRILAARDSGETVCVWGDYDVDGVCATAILCLCFDHMGVNHVHHIPDRHKEGYGLNEAGIREEAQRASLLITVDCGISCRGEVALARELGMDVIVTDHHTPGDNMPEGLVIDPLFGGYPYEKLCGAGVALKLVQALMGIDEAIKLIDLAALATVADIVPLTGENRAIVSLGLRKINEDPRPGVAALIAAAGMHGKEIKSGNIAFQLAPRINAGGRLGDAGRGFDLLTTEDSERARALAKVLEEENNARRDEESQIGEACVEMMKTYDLTRHKIIVLCGEGWNSGVIGLAASKLQQDTDYPVILLARDGDMCVGSCRSIPAVDIFSALRSVSDLMIRFGGHRQAAGLLMKYEHLEEFIARLDEYLMLNTTPDDYIRRIEYDIPFSFEGIDQASVKMLDKLQPTGFGNPNPLFLTTAEVESARAVGRDLSHLQMMLSQKGMVIKGICFGKGDMADDMPGTLREILYTPSLNEWRSQISVQLEVKEIFPETPDRVMARFIEKYARFLRLYLTDFLYNIDPDAPVAEDNAISPEDVARALQEDHQGTIVCCLTDKGLDSFRAFMTENGLEGKMDVLDGKWPQEGSLNNTLCLCPVGKGGGRWKKIILWDAPARAFLSFPEGEVRSACQYDKGTWLARLPGVSDLRKVFMSVRLFAAAPVTRLACESIERDLSRSTGLQYGPSLQAALCILDHMGLIEYDRANARLHCLPTHKADPEQDTLFKRIHSITEEVV